MLGLIDLDGLLRVTLYGARQNEFHEFRFDDRAFGNKFPFCELNVSNNAERLCLPNQEFQRVFARKLRKAPSASSSAI